MSRSLSNKDAGFRNKQERAEYFLLDERRLRQTKVTDLDRKLWEKVIQFSDFFEDMLFTPGTITYPFLECKISDDNGNEIAPTAVLPVGLHNFNYNSFYYRVREMTPPYMAYAAPAWRIRRCVPSAEVAAAVRRENKCWKSIRRSSP